MTNSWRFIQEIGNSGRKKFKKKIWKFLKILFLRFRKKLQKNISLKYFQETEVSGRIQMQVFHGAKSSC